MLRFKRLGILAIAVFAALGLNAAPDLSGKDEGLDRLAINGTNYKTAIGIRALGTSGLTIKHFLSAGTAIEGIVGFYPNALSVTALYEKYSPAFDVPGLKWYYGLGGHIAAESNFVNDGREGRFADTDSDLGFGIDGIFGLEYKIDQTPIALSLDLKPFIEVNTNGNAFLFADPGLGVKVTF